MKKLLALSILTASSLLAVTPNIGDISKQVEPPKDIPQKDEKSLVEIGGVKKYAPSMIEDTSGKKISVKSFKIDGAVNISEESLQSLIASYNNKELTFTQIKEITSIITKEYRQKGYFVARAYVPVQSMQNGIVTIAIIEGSYGEFKLTNESNVNDSIVQGMLDDAKVRGNVVSTDTLERSMLIINDTPGAVVTKADVAPGKEVGSSDFIIQTEATAPYDGYVIADNYGSRYTGENRLMAGVNVNSPLKLGDKLSVNGLVSNGQNLKNGRIAYSAPLMSNGLKGEVSYSDTTYSLTKNYEALDAQGTSKTLDATLTYPIIRTRLESLFVSLNVANKDLKDETRSTNDKTEKDAQVMNLGLQYDKTDSFFGLDSKTLASITYTFGDLNFKDENKKASDLAGANTEGTYSKIGFTLGKNIAFTNELSLENSFKYQHSLNNKNLDGSEDLSIGGNNGVKVYPDGELSAENGYVFSTEAKYKLPIISSIGNTVGVFYDRGRAYMADNSRTGFDSKSLQDIGLGHYLTYKNLFVNTKVAWTVNSDAVQSEKASNSRVLFQSGFVF